MKSILFSIAVLFFMGTAFAELNCECYKRSKVSTRIVGGGQVDKEEYPWLVSIVAEESTLNITALTVCHGVIVNENYVLTAASCLPEEETLEQVKLRFNGIEELKNISNVIIHPKFNVTGDFFFVNDIALIKLKESLKFGDTKTIRPACLATRFRKEYRGDLFVAGEGSTTAVEIDEDGNITHFEPSEELKQAIVKDETKNAEACKDRQKTTLCVHNTKEENSLCLGDAGTGIHKETNKGVKFVVGVASHPTHEYDEEKKTAKLCKSGASAARVSAYIGWIKETVGEEYCSFNN